MPPKTAEPTQTNSRYVVETKYSIKDAAARIGISPSGVRRLLNTGKLGYYQSGRRRIVGEGHITQYMSLIVRNSPAQSIH